MKKRLTRGSRFAFLVLLAVLLLALPVSSLAFEQRTGTNVTVAADEVIADDLYVAAESVAIDGTVQGDLVVAARDVTINGVVEGDILCAAQTLVISGQARDDVRFAGAVIELHADASVGDDLQMMGYSLEAEHGSTVGGAIACAGSQAILAGTVSQHVFFAGNGLEIQGGVGGDVSAYVSQPGQMPWTRPTEWMRELPPVPGVLGGLTISPEANIGGNVLYRAPAASSIPPSAITGRVEFTPTRDPNEPQFSWQPHEFGQWAGRVWVWEVLRRFAALLVLGLLAALLLPHAMVGWADALSERPLACLVWGLVTTIAFPFAALLFLAIVIATAVVLGIVTLGNLGFVVVVIGVPAFILFIALYLLAAIYLSKLVVALWLGRAILGRLNENWSTQVLASVLLGVIILTVFLSVPCLGSVLGLIVTWLGIGALWVSPRV